LTKPQTVTIQHNELIKSEEGLNRMRKYLSSVGVYGNTPFICSMYGISEIPQAFCRLCAVFSGIYILRRSIECLVLTETEQSYIYKGIKSGSQTFTSKYLVTSPEFVPTMVTQISGISRCVLITDKSISQEANLVKLIFPPNSINNNPNSIFVLQYNQITLSVPQGKFLIHLITKSVQGNSAKQELETVVQNLFNSQMEGTAVENTKPKILWGAYFNQAIREKLPKIPENVFICSDPDDTLDFETCVQQAKEKFTAMYPGEEFLPMTPGVENDGHAVGTEVEE